MPILLRSLVISLSLLTACKTTHYPDAGETGANIRLAVRKHHIKGDYIFLYHRSLAGVCTLLAQAYHQDSIIFRQPINIQKIYGDGMLNYKIIPLDTLLGCLTQGSKHYTFQHAGKTIFVEQKE